MNPNWILIYSGIYKTPDWLKFQWTKKNEKLYTTNVHRRITFYLYQIVTKLLKVFALVFFVERYKIFI